MDSTGKHQITINFTNLPGGVKAVRNARFQEDPGRPVFDFVEIDVDKSSRCSYVASIRVAGLDESRFKFYMRDNLWDAGPHARYTLKPESFPFRCGEYYFMRIYDVGLTRMRLVQK